MIYLQKTQKYVTYVLARGNRKADRKAAARVPTRPLHPRLYYDYDVTCQAVLSRGGGGVERRGDPCGRLSAYLSGPSGIEKCQGKRLVPALVNALMIALLALFITSCGAQQIPQPDPRLKAFRVLSARIIMQDTQAEVDGTLQNASRTDRFPYDVTIIATFYNSAGNIVGQAGGVAEDVYPGMVRPFTLMGQVDSTQYSHMVLKVVSLKERRIEKIIPTPSIVP